jgi:hypothetical protein
MHNIGICENFLRAEQFAFMTLKAPVAYFFEVDLVLSPHYLSALDVLRRALCGRRVGYFSACGSFASGSFPANFATYEFRARGSNRG